ncbi:2-amino-4-hydroxy-6-hydroxymethyldihydropteridine diphosphokinase [Altererythrobacter sp. MF3-039]|uniref:2-amino-4-hydroxy-6- hydroxymethyldihydropteridine diphosphokinase n=1 Tax=Altererythrobacter sp. MF3-039 TaxID=3252901 RepID=UPI00390CCDCE
MRGYLSHTYLIALGSNMRTARDGSPRKVLASAIEVLEDLGLFFRAVSDVIDTAPIGPSQRRYANAVAVIETKRDPEELLGLLRATEDVFGRQRRGQRWRARPLDLDIVLWDEGIWASPQLQIPHPRFRERDFVLGPASQIAGDWRDPVSGFSLRQLNARLTRNRPIPR